MENKKYTFQDFQDIIAQLRGEGGCPWDQKQTHSTLKSCLEEETQEVLEGIDIYERTGDGENLCEELGDLLLQVVMHSVIAQEEGLFTMEDVIQGVAEKMVRRHPHVFKTDREWDNLTWEEIKKLEKRGKTT